MTVQTRTVPNYAKALVAVLFAALFFFGLQAPAAYAAADVDVTVHVTTKTGAPLAGLKVYAYPVENHAVVGEGVVGDFTSGGTYTFKQPFVDATHPGNRFNTAKHYAIYFDAPANATTAFDQFWGGTTFVEEAHYWDYAGDGQTLDISLATNSTFTGKVTGLAGKLLAGVVVYPYRWDGNGWYRLDWAKATTASTGVYTMRNLEPGTYRLEFAPSNTIGYLSEFSGNTSVEANAAALTLGLGATVTYNAALAVGGSITGKVRITQDDIDYIPYGITAYAFPYDSGTHKIDVLHAFASRATGNDGKWTISGLPAGQYKVKLYDTATSAFVDVWANGSTGASSVSDPTVTVFTVALAKTTTAAGVPILKFYDNLPDTSLVINATDESGDPLGLDSTIYIESISGEDFYFQSDADYGFQNGVLYLPFMPVGDYRVWIDPADQNSQPYIADTWHIVAQPGGNTWTIHLAARTGFSYSAPPLLPTIGDVMGMTYTVDRGHTTLDDGSAPDSDVEYSYIWLRDDTPIFGSQSTTSASYTSRGVDQGHKISVIVRADAFGYDPVFWTLVASNSVLQGPAANNLTAPVITGPASAVPGSVLSASAGTWNSSGLTFAYQWYRDYGGGPQIIAGATNRAYTAVGADAGADLTVSVSASRVGYLLSSAYVSDPKAVGFLAAPKFVKASTFSATTLAGGDVKLSATPGTWSPAGTSYEYLWYADGVLLSSGGANPYTCAAADCAGKAIEVAINVYREGYNTASKRYVVRKGTTALVNGDVASIADMSVAGTPAVGLGQPAQIGHSLKAFPQVYLYPNGAGTVSYAYQWYANGAAISGATKQTYVPTTSVLNKALTVRITVTSSLFPTGVSTIPAGTVRYLQNLVAGPHPSVSIDGTGLAGTVKRVLTTGVWPVSGVTQSYQWYRCDSNTLDCSTFPTNWTAITGATASTYTPPLATTPAGTLLQARVTGSKTGYQAFALLTGSFAITNSDLNDVMAFTTPSYASGLTGGTTGNATVAKAVVAKQSTLDRTAGVTRTLDWQDCADASCNTVNATLPGTTTFTPAASMLADGNPHWIRFREHIFVNGTSRIQVLTAPVPVVPAAWAAVTAPRVTSAPDPITPSETRYTVNTGTWPAGVTPTFTYQWHDGATSTSTDAYVTPAAGTTPIWVTVTAKRTGYVDLVYTLVGRKGTLPPQTPALSGAAYGDTLALAAPLSIPVNVPAATFTYQWYNGSAAISGATKATFVPSTAYIGKSLTLRVKVTSAFYNPVTVVSAPVVLTAHAPSPGSVAMISTPNTFAPGAKLSASLTGYASGMTYAYSWEISPDGTAPFVKVASTSTYVLPTTAVDKVVRLTVTATRSGWTSVTRSSLGATVNYTPGLNLTSPFLLGGTAKVDTTISAPTTWDTTGMTLAYRWTRNGVTIPGATASTIVPTASWFGDEIQAHVTATKPGYLTKVVDSNEVSVGLGAAPVATSTSVSPTGALHDSGPITVSSVWNTAGLTLTYKWYDDQDVTRTTVLYTGATQTNVTINSYNVVITAHRAGYADGEKVVHLVVNP